MNANCILLASNSWPKTTFHASTPLCHISLVTAQHATPVSGWVDTISMGCQLVTVATSLYENMFPGSAAFKHVSITLYVMLKLSHWYLVAIIKHAAWFRWIWINKIICCRIFILYSHTCVKVIVYPALSIRQQGNLYSFSEHYSVVLDSWENKEKIHVLVTPTVLYMCWFSISLNWCEVSFFI